MKHTMRLPHGPWGPYRTNIPPDADLTDSPRERPGPRTLPTPPGNTPVGELRPKLLSESILGHTEVFLRDARELAVLAVRALVETIHKALAVNQDAQNSGSEVNQKALSQTVQGDREFGCEETAGVAQVLLGQCGEGDGVVVLQRDGLVTQKSRQNHLQSD